MCCQCRCFFLRFNYRPRRHILLKDETTDSQIKKHVLSHNVCKGWIQDSNLVVPMLTILIAWLPSSVVSNIFI